MRRGIHRDSWRANNCNMQRGKQIQHIYKGNIHTHTTNMHVRIYAYTQACTDSHMSSKIRQLNLSSKSSPCKATVTTGGFACCPTQTPQKTLYRKQGGEDPLLIASLISDLELALGSRELLKSTCAHKQLLISNMINGRKFQTYTHRGSTDGAGHE